MYKTERESERSEREKKRKREIKREREGRTVEWKEGGKNERVKGGGRRGRSQRTIVLFYYMFSFLPSLYFLLSPLSYCFSFLLFFYITFLLYHRIARKENSTWLKNSRRRFFSSSSSALLSPSIASSFLPFALPNES